MAGPNRDLTVDTLRAVAVILMVAGHVIGGNVNDGLQVGDGSVWRYVFTGLEDVRMPLFAALSGYVYARRPAVRSTYAPMVLGKSRRLLVPLLTVGSTFFVLQSLIPGTNNPHRLSEIWRVPVEGYGQFWFLLAVFVIFVVVGLADALGLMESKTTWLFVVTFSVSAFILIEPAGLSLFSLGGALRLAPFFLIGYGAHRYFPRLVDNWPVILGFAALMTAAYTSRMVGPGSEAPAPPPLERALQLTVGASAVIILFGLRRVLANRRAAWLGQFAFSIYLLHVFGAAASRIALERSGLTDPTLVFFLVVPVAVVLPVTFEMALGRFRLVSWGVLGQEPQRHLVGVPVERPA